MLSYTLNQNGSAAQKVIDGVETGEWVNVQTNADYLAWLAAGNTPSPFVPPVAPVPQAVPLWAVRTVLTNHGLFTQADALITASTDVGLKNVWQYGNYVDRDSAAIATLAAAMGLTSEQVDTLFQEAGALTV